MADVHVTTYAELQNAVTSATEATDIYVDNDINVDDEYPTGIPSSVTLGSKTFSVVIHGQNHSIRNLLMDTNIKVFRGNKVSSDTKYWLRLYDLNLENFQIQPTGTTGGLFGDCVEVLRCKVSVTIIMGTSSTSNSYPFATEDTSIQRSALTITGANSIVRPSLQIGGNYYCDFNNIRLYGEFNYFILNGVRNSYISGDWKQVNSSSDTYKIMSCTVCIINATIDMTTKMFSASGSSCVFLNTDNVTKSSGSSYPSTITLCTTTDLQDRSIMRQKGFPIR